MKYLALATIVCLITSCSLHIEKRRYSRGYHVEITKRILKKAKASKRTLDHVGGFNSEHGAGQISSELITDSAQANLEIVPANVDSIQQEIKNPGNCVDTIHKVNGEDLLVKITSVNDENIFYLRYIKKDVKVLEFLPLDEVTAYANEEEPIITVVEEEPVLETLTEEVGEIEAEEVEDEKITEEPLASTPIIEKRMSSPVIQNQIKIEDLSDVIVTFKGDTIYCDVSQFISLSNMSFRKMIYGKIYSDRINLNNVRLFVLNESKDHVLSSGVDADFNIQSENANVLGTIYKRSRFPVAGTGGKEIGAGIGTVVSFWFVLLLSLMVAGFFIYITGLAGLVISVVPNFFIWRAWGRGERKKWDAIRSRKVKWQRGIFS